MDLYTAARQFPEMSVTIRLGDLLRANEILARNIREEAQEEIRRNREQYGDVLIPKDEARRILANPSESTLWRWEQAGYLVPVRLGVKVHYRRSDIDRIIKSKEKK